MLPEIGLPFPALSIVDQDGLRTDLDQIRAGRPAVVFFMRAHNCMICLRHVRALAESADALDEHKTVPIVVVPGSAADAGRVRRRAGGLPVVSSVGDAAHRAAGLEKRLLMQHSGTFLVDADGLLRYARTGALPTASFDRGELLAALAQLP
ncbi:MAG: redoxin domain-containing protein [Hamadaea sp.]|uniref:redoxin domain-containing protein n=1 Tax=Hamadaea sp. TaxID=2024425 RepID=UPI00182A300D|nr:redoxin domain-containing protein [Hamadaea sp.]NUT22487.1 redoxin domain-containing protein [Hamadaea sp.]